MGKRSSGRKVAMQLLYQSELRKDPIETVITEFLETTEVPGSEKNVWACELAKNTANTIPLSDQIIKKYAIDWDINRINPIDKSLLRMAIYEMTQMDTPINVALDEAIEIAKEYSTDDSGKFINGILGNFVKSELKKGAE